MSFVRAAALSQIPADRGLRVTIGSVELGIFRVDDDVYAIENACPHAGYPLSEGELEGPLVICCAHGWEFDLRSGGSPDAPDTALLRRFAVRVEGEDVWVDLERPL